MVRPYNFTRRQAEEIILFAPVLSKAEVCGGLTGK